MTDGKQLIVNIACSDAVELVTDYLDQVLSLDDLARFKHHLAHCEGCTVFVNQVKMTITLTSAISKQKIQLMPDNFDELLGLLADRDTN